MKTLLRISLLPALAMCSAQIWAQQSCGDYPPGPSLLNQPYLDFVEIEKAENSYREFYNGVQAFLSCLDKRVMALDPEAENYEQRFNLHDDLRQHVMRNEQLVTDRYNYLLDNVRSPDPEPVVDIGSK